MTSCSVESFKSVAVVQEDCQCCCFLCLCLQNQNQDDSWPAAGYTRVGSAHNHTSNNLPHAAEDLFYSTQSVCGFLSGLTRTARTEMDEVTLMSPSLHQRWCVVLRSNTFTRKLGDCCRTTYRKRLAAEPLWHRAVLLCKTYERALVCFHDDTDAAERRDGENVERWLCCLATASSFCST